MTALIALALAVRLIIRFSQRRRWHTWFYAVSLSLAAAAAGTDAVARAQGVWPAPAFRVYWFSAAGLVALMGVGTCTLLLSFLPRRRKFNLGPAVAGFLGALLSVITLWLLYRAVSMDISGLDMIAHDATATKAPPGVRLPFILASSLGALTIFGGALYSWIASRRSFNIWIALGALAFSMGGSAAALGGSAMFYLSQSFGSVLLYVGVAGSLQPVASSNKLSLQGHG